MAKQAASNESFTNALRTPAEVTAKVEQLLFDAINKAEMALKQLPQKGAEVLVSVNKPAKKFEEQSIPGSSGQLMANCCEIARSSPYERTGMPSNIIHFKELKHESPMALMKDSNRRRSFEEQSSSTVKIQPGSSTEQLFKQHPAEGSEIVGSSPLVLNERPGVRYLCCDRFFKCGGRSLVAREIWPSDGGCIELNRRELKRFILDNEARRSDGSEYSRRKAGASPQQQSEAVERTSSNNKLFAAQSSTTNLDTSLNGSNTTEVYRQKRGSSPVIMNSAINIGTRKSNNNNDDELLLQNNIQQQNITELIGHATSEETLSSITETPETLISDTTDVSSQAEAKEVAVAAAAAVDAESQSNNKSSSMTETYDFMQNRGDQLTPVIKSDGTIVIPGVVHVNNIKSLSGVVLELKVLIKSPDESRRFSVKIDCPDFKPTSVRVNGIEETNLLTDDDAPRQQLFQS